MALNKDIIDQFTKAYYINKIQADNIYKNFNSFWGGCTPVKIETPNLDQQLALDILSEFGCVELYQSIGWDKIKYNQAKQFSAVVSPLLLSNGKPKWRREKLKNTDRFGWMPHFTVEIYKWEWLLQNAVREEVGIDMRDPSSIDKVREVVHSWITKRRPKSHFPDHGMKENGI